MRRKMLVWPYVSYQVLSCPSRKNRRLRPWPWSSGTIKHRTAIFRQINREVSTSHHDALEFPDGQIILLTFLHEGQQATVLQLPVTHHGLKEAKPEEARAS